MSKHSALIKGEELRSYQAQPCGPRQAAFTLFQPSHPRKENNICSPPSPGCWEMAMNVCTVLQAQKVLEKRGAFRFQAAYLNVAGKGNGVLRHLWGGHDRFIAGRNV